VLLSRTFMPAVFAAALFATVPVRAAEISGAGATFPYPIYAKWAEAYKEKTGTAMNYQSIGSGGGIKQIEAKTVDFGASDMPLTPDKLDADKLQQFPMVMGGVVPVVNLSGIQSQARRQDAGRDLSRHDYELERQGDRRVEPRSDAS
jgi:phosphate transport system substrate-binding protein